MKGVLLSKQEINAFTALYCFAFWSDSPSPELLALRRKLFKRLDALKSELVLAKKAKEEVIEEGDKYKLVRFTQTHWGVRDKKDGSLTKECEGETFEEILSILGWYKRVFPY
jgi:hypothetical protein